MTTERKPQLAYSELMDKMLDEQARRRKASKLIAVVTHFLGRTDLSGLTALDVGCSGGFISDELATAGARTIGIDIDEPGLAKAQARFGDRVSFLSTDGAALPFPDGSIDVIVFNHIYEHVVEPERVVAEMHRVLSDDGVVYFGLMNRLGVIEPHYRLPFLSYLPQPLADRYLRVTRKGEHYYERSMTIRGLRRLTRVFRVWDYTVPIVLEAERFHSDDVVPAAIRRLPGALARAALPVVPTYVWIGTKSAAAPRGAVLRYGPVLR
jgi:2-polyprenyl-3-methyl-5-hydroxy-6-metoxy-1,4-benzoquinol methylase